VPATTTLGLFALAALALIAVPGPNLVYIAARSMHEGRTLGFAADCLYALGASSAARRLGGWRHGRALTGAVYLALGTTAAAFGGRVH
jgi:threonine/homoserine/homoserine lactone efflux protein